MLSTIIFWDFNLHTVLSLRLRLDQYYDQHEVELQNGPKVIFNIIHILVEHVSIKFTILSPRRNRYIFLFLQSKNY